MSEQLTKEELIRLSWLTELRRQGERQCQDRFEDGKGGVCALGLLREVAGLTPTTTAESGRLAGLTPGQSHLVAALNDGVPSWGIPKRTFSEVADVVEGWFKDQK